MYVETLLLNTSKAHHLLARELNVMEIGLKKLAGLLAISLTESKEYATSRRSCNENLLTERHAKVLLESAIISTYSSVICR